MQFVVCGEADGQPALLATSTAGLAESLAATITTYGSWASWMVATDEGLDEAGVGQSLTVFGRLRPGVAGETRRVTHAFVIESDTLLPDQLVAACGEVLPRGDLDMILNLGSGMPCEACLARLRRTQHSPHPRNRALPRQPKGQLPPQRTAEPWHEYGPDGDLMNRVLQGLRNMRS